MNWVDLSGMSGGLSLPSVVAPDQSDCSLFQDRLKSKDKQMEELRNSLIEARNAGSQCDAVRSELDATKASENNLRMQLKNADRSATENAKANSMECPACPEAGQSLQELMPFLNCGQVDQREVDFEVTARDPQDPTPMGIVLSVMKDKSAKLSLRIFPGMSDPAVTCPYYMTKNVDRETVANGGRVCFDPSDQDSCFDFKDLTASLTDKEAMKSRLGTSVGRVREHGGEFEDLIFTSFSETRRASSGPSPGPSSGPGTPSRQRVRRRRGYMRKIVGPVARLSF